MDLLHKPQYQDRIRQLLKDRHVPGLAVAFTHKDETTTASFGVASLESEEPVTENTLFDIASCSKSFTAAAVAKLVEDPALPDVRYDSIMSELLPDDFVMPDPKYTEQVTVDDILGHRSGMGRHDFSYLGQMAETPDTLQSITRNLRNLSIDAPLRTKEIYNNMMYTVAAYLVEVKSGMSFGDFIHTKLIEPLGMNATNLHASRARDAGLESHFAVGYAWQEKEDKYWTIPVRDIPEGDGAGNILTCASDGIKWIKAMMNHEGPITKDVYEGILKARTISDQDASELRPYTSPMMYCAGWGRYHYRGYEIVSHGGGDPGFTSYHFFTPVLRFGGVTYGNAENASVVGPMIARELLDEILGLPGDERPDWLKVFDDEDAEDDDDDKDTDKPDEKWKKFYPDVEKSQPQEWSLDKYTGAYTNRGSTTSPSPPRTISYSSMPRIDR